MCVFMYIENYVHNKTSIHAKTNESKNFRLDLENFNIVKRELEC